MIRIKTNHKHSHDIYELVRAFYPGEEIQISRNKAQICSSLEGIEATSSLVHQDKEIINKESLEDFPVFKSLGRWESKLLKHSLYSLLRREGDKPWGMLTGIRPGKLARSIGDLGLDLEEVLQKNFFLSKTKAGLLSYLYQVQKPIIQAYKRGYSLYINIPFCPSICTYCSYPVLPVSRYKNEIAPYVDKLIEEIDYVFEVYGSPSMVYIGGGTPSAIGTVQLEKVIAKALSRGRPDEFTVEVGREDTITRDLLKMMAGSASRICINPQSMTDSSMKLIGRSQTSKGVIEAYDLARTFDFKINMDTILGLPGEGLESLESSFDKLVDLGPDNITVHTLAMKKDARLTKLGFESQADIGAMVDLAGKKLGQGSYKPYYVYRQKDILGNFENTGYTKEGSACSYNIVSMEETQSIIGTGMGAVSKFVNQAGPIRRANFKSLRDYMERFDEVLEKKLT